MTNVMRRLLGREYPVAVGGDGPYVIDAAGRRYLDAASGAGVSCLGHSATRVADAIAAQAHTMPYLYNAYFTTDAVERFAEALVAATPAGLDWVYPGSGGSESMDGALKLALQFHNENPASELSWMYDWSIGREREPDPQIALRGLSTPASFCLALLCLP
jgi:adenosylmethionine-8-amino-7-oxononanoate aminotransferase